MNNKYDSLIKNFESNIKKLIAENQTLTTTNQTLTTELKRKQEDLMIAHKEIIELQNQYEDLLSTNIAGNTSTAEGREKFKHFLENMIDEVDKCIKLINGQ